MLSGIVERTETKKERFRQVFTNRCLTAGIIRLWLLCSFNCFEKFEHICEDLNLPLMKRPQVAIFHSTARVLRKEHTSFRRCFVECGVAENHFVTFENTAISFEFSLLAQRYRMLSVLKIKISLRAKWTKIQAQTSFLEF